MIVVSVTALLGTGCNWLIPVALMQEHKRTIPAEFDKLAGKRVMVLVWAEPETLFDYPHVRLELSKYISDKLMFEVKDIFIVDPIEVEDRLERSLGAQTGPEQLGRHFEADMVVYLELLEFQIRDPDVPDLIQAQIGASVCVHDLTVDPDETNFYELTPVHVTEPDGEPRLMSRGSVVQVRRDAYLKFSEVVARKFYAWEEFIE
jgi:hypothetical protein